MSSDPDMELSKALTDLLRVLADRIESGGEDAPATVTELAVLAGDMLVWLNRRHAGRVEHRIDQVERQLAAADRRLLREEVTADVLAEIQRLTDEGKD